MRVNLELLAQCAVLLLHQSRPVKWVSMVLHFFISQIGILGCQTFAILAIFYLQYISALFADASVVFFADIVPSPPFLLARFEREN